ncbi:MAG: substrate-binding domain-containing protein [Candidatus Limnocylindrales bacterium]
MSRPLTRFPLLLAAVALVISACGSSNATPTAVAPATAGTQASAAPGTSAIAATSPGTGGGSAAQFCSGMKITFFPGGAPGGSFETVVYNGAKAAQAAFGPDVNYLWSNWDPATMITQFQQAVASKPDGLAIMGHPGDASFDPLIADAVKQGMLVTVMNTELQTAEATYGLGYTGAVLHDAGASLAKEAIKRGNLKSGDEVFVWGLKAQAGRGQRTLGITDTLAAAGLKVDYYEIDTATNADPNAGTATFTGYVASHPNVKAIFIDHGNLTAAIPTFMKAANLAPGSVFAAGFDMSPATVTGIQQGYVSLVIDQQEYLQGFFGIEQLCLEKKYGFGGLFINTGAGFVDKTNIAAIAPLVTAQIR